MKKKPPKPIPVQKNKYQRFLEHEQTLNKKPKPVPLVKEKQ